MIARSLLAATVLLLGAHTASAENQMMDALKNKLGGGNKESSSGGGLAQGLGMAMPAVGASTAGNAAGVLQYCVKNNYLSADAAGGVKDKLMGMVTGNKTQQTGYSNGSNGVLQGSDGKSLNLKNVGGKLKTKACDYVLSNAKSLV